jgi:hypothetical protein
MKGDGMSRKALCAFLAIMWVGVGAVNAVTVTGTVTDSTTHNPIAGATVNLIAGGAQTATTSNTGTYTFNNIPSTTGTGYIYVTANGYTTAGQPITSFASNLTINIALVPTGTTGGTGTIQGQVTDTTANAIQGAQVVLRTTTGGGNVTAVDTVLTNGSGNFTFDSLANGTYTIRVTKTGYQT